MKGPISLLAKVLLCSMTSLPSQRRYFLSVNLVMSLSIQYSLVAPIALRRKPTGKRAFLIWSLPIHQLPLPTSLNYAPGTGALRVFTFLESTMLVQATPTATLILPTNSCLSGITQFQ